MEHIGHTARNDKPTMHFAALTLPLKFPESHEPLTVAEGVYAHAAILQRLSRKDPTLGRTLHNQPRHKPMTLALLSPSSNTNLLRLTFMEQGQNNYLEKLFNALSEEGLLRIGRVMCELGPIDISPGEWSGLSNWTDLARSSAGRFIRFAFATPTTITKRGTIGGRFSALFPEPEDVFASLLRRWQALEGPPLPEDLLPFVRGGGCVVCDYSLRAISFQTTDRTQVGFIGWVVYECRGTNSSYWTALSALARLAFFTGVGYQTTRGMGAVQTQLSN